MSCCTWLGEGSNVAAGLIGKLAEPYLVGFGFGIMADHSGANYYCQCVVAEDCIYDAGQLR